MWHRDGDGQAERERTVRASAPLCARHGGAVARARLQETHLCAVRCARPTPRQRSVSPLSSSEVRRSARLEILEAMSRRCRPGGKRLRAGRTSAG
ncbi:hypothetical protein C8T65DRAFT_669642 [Cerioporus squamosus]|nr:hypothetical protein C8T65DRAFT_669642 [Cerioporus squamosus]